MHSLLTVERKSSFYCQQAVHMTREPEEAMVEALLTALGDVQHAESMLQSALKAGHDCLLYFINIGKDSG